MYEVSKMTVVALGLALPMLAASQTMLPQARTEGAVTYLSGGIGHEEALAMRQEAKHYPLSMVFSEGKRGEFVSDIHVTIKDKSGKTMLDAVSDGPIMVVKLPAGEYSLTADMHGKVLHRTARISDKGSVQEAFNWPLD